MDEINFFPDDLETKDQKIILRLDLNVPIKDKVIKDDTRITLCLPFINRLIEKKAKIIIIILAFLLINFFRKGKHNVILVSSVIILFFRGTFKSNLRIIF